MIRFLAGTLLGAFTGYALAALRADVPTEKATSFGLRAIEDVEDFEVERRTRPNVVPLTLREEARLRLWMAEIPSEWREWRKQYGDEPLGVG